MTIASFDDARIAVKNGTAAEDAAWELVTAMTPEERLWCLDGDNTVARHAGDPAGVTVEIDL
jgi:hypothetical protein